MFLLWALFYADCGRFSILTVGAFLSWLCDCVSVSMSVSVSVSGMYVCMCVCVCFAHKNFFNLTIFYINLMEIVIRSLLQD